MSLTVEPGLEPQALDTYAQPRLARSLLDVATSVVPYLALTALMFVMINTWGLLTVLVAAPAYQRARHRRRPGGCGHRAVLAGWVEGRVDRLGPVGAAGRIGRHLAVLRPAPVRRRVLAPRRGLDLHRCRIARQLLPAPAQDPAVLHGQHRTAPRAPPQRPDSQLQPAAGPRRDPRAARRADALAARRAAGRAPQAVG